MGSCSLAAKEDRSTGLQRGSRSLAHLRTHPIPLGAEHYSCVSLLLRQTPACAVGARDVFAMVRLTCTWFPYPRLLAPCCHRMI